MHLKIGSICVASPKVAKVSKATVAAGDVFTKKTFSNVKTALKTKGAFTLANFAHDFTLSLNVFQKKNYLLNVQT